MVSTGVRKVEIAIRRPVTAYQAGNLKKKRQRLFFDGGLMPPVSLLLLTAAESGADFVRNCPA